MKTTLTNFKKNKYMLFFLTLFMMISYTSFSQDSLMVFPDWMSSEGSQNFFYRNVTKTDAVSNVYIVGATINGSGNTDILVAKYNSSGVLQWSNQYDGTGNGEDMGTGLYIDGSGNVYITGTTQTSSTDADIITIKYNSSGTQQWLSTYDGTGNSYDSGSEIVVDNGDVYITGSSYNSTPNTDVIAIKYNSSGTQQWATAYNYTSNLNDAGVKISVNSSWVVVSCIVQTGTTSWKWGTINFNKTTGAYTTGRISASSSTGIDQVNDMVEDASGNIYIVGATPVFGQGYNYDIIKLTSTLSLAWENTYNSSNLDDIAKGIRVDASGNVYVTGYTTSSTEGKNITTIKYNSSGTQQWIETYNDTLDEDDEAYAMEIDASGNIYVTGYETTAMDQADYFTIKYDASGNEIWKIHNDGQKHLNDKSTNIAIDTNGDIVISGSSETAPGEYEYLTVKYVEKNIIIPADYDDESPNSSFSYYKNFGQLINTDGDSIPDIIYYAKNSSPEFYFKDNSYSMVFAKVDTVISTEDTLHRIDVAFSKSNPNAKTYSLEETKSYSNYYLAQCPEGITEVYGNQRLVTTDIYSNIDVMYSSNQDGIKMYFIVKPGGDPTEIMMEYDGESSFNLDGTSNELTINSSIGDITFERPSIYQLDEDNVVVDTFTVWTPAWYTDSTDNYYKFNVGSYNTNAPLIIQVDLGHTQSQSLVSNVDWSTYFGGDGRDGIYGTVIDAQGHYILSGYTWSTNFPTVNGPYSSQINGSDIVMCSFNSNYNLQYSTYYGGTDWDAGHDVDVDNNCVYVISTTASTDIPLFQYGSYYYNGTFTGDVDMIITMISKSTGAILWSTNFGGSAVDYGNTIKILGSSIYVAGETFSSNFPIENLTGAYNQSSYSNGEAFICRFDNGNLVWSTFFGGSYLDGAYDLNIKNNNIYLLGVTHSNDLTIYHPSSEYYQNYGGGSDLFLVKFDSNGSLNYSTYIGGSDDDDNMYHGLNVDENDNVVIVGLTYSNDFPVQDYGGSSYYDATLNGTHNGFIFKLTDQLQLEWGTYFGNDIDCIYNSVFYNGALFVTGYTESSSFYTIDFGTYYYQTDIGYGLTSPPMDAFITGFNSDNEIRWSTYFGGGDDSYYGYEVGFQLEVYNDLLYLCGETNSRNTNTSYDKFLLLNPGNVFFQQYYGGGNNDAFVTVFKIDKFQIGIKENELNSKFLEVYPNPFIDKLYIKNQDGSSIVLMDNIGKIVYSGKIKDGKIDLPNLSKGVYSVQIFNDTFVYNKKVLKF